MMKRVLVTLAAAAMLVAGCSSSTEDASAPTDAAPASDSTDSASSDEADAAAVDEILDHFITATVTLVQMDAETPEGLLGEFDEANAELSVMSIKLGAGIPGVPDSTISPIIDALDESTASLTALTDCFRADEGNSCDTESTVLGEVANRTGQEVAALIPYGSRSSDEVLALLQGEGSGSAAEPDAGADMGSTSDSGSSSGMESVSESNAREKAQEYLAFSAFSRQGLIEQLEYEGFSSADATYGADASGADWNEQAALKAQQYLDMSAFSRQGLIEQLEYEGFTSSQAAYGVSAVGL